jgi:hypothetical protein
MFLLHTCVADIATSRPFSLSSSKLDIMAIQLQFKMARGYACLMPYVFTTYCLIKHWGHLQIYSVLWPRIIKLSGDLTCERTYVIIILSRIGFPERDFLGTVSTVNCTGWYCCTPDVKGFAGVNKSTTSFLSGSTFCCNYIDEIYRRDSVLATREGEIVSKEGHVLCFVLRR